MYELLLGAQLPRQAGREEGTDRAAPKPTRLTGPKNHSLLDDSLSRATNAPGVGLEPTTVGLTGHCSAD